jgi:hypothetical protein
MNPVADPITASRVFIWGTIIYRLGGSEVWMRYGRDPKIGITFIRYGLDELDPELPRGDTYWL